MIFWGPPGSVKPPLPDSTPRPSRSPFTPSTPPLAASPTSKKSSKKSSRPRSSSSALLFVDEIHRFNKAQQDAFLPYVEDGTLILIGSTAENPSFYLNNALLSRVRVLILNALSDNDLEKLLLRYENAYTPLNLTPEQRLELIHLSHGDGRYLFNLIENIQTATDPIDLKLIAQRKAALFDKGDDQHYNLISALHKSVRGSDPDAALYWFAGY